MDGLDKWKIALGVLYVITSIVLILSAYYYYIRKFKRNKLKALSGVSLITSRENIFSSKTRFLIISPEICSVKIDILDSEENFLKTLLDEEIDNGELPFDFNPEDFGSGKYYLYSR